MLLIATLMFSLSACGTKAEATYDYILKGGTVVDGTNSKPYEADVAASGIYYSMSEEDVYTIMPQDYICVGSDGSAYNFADKTLPHPRNFATFPQFFQTVREKNLIPIETAVYKCTGLPAEVMGLSDRGVLKEGNAADIVVFDFEKIKSNSTYEDSRKKCDGIELIVVNGKATVENGKIINKNPGKTLLHK